ncbi:MAG: chemotaxis protein CheA [Pseudomonadota bacterium]
MDDIAQLFIDESQEGLDVMESGLLNLDLGAADPDTMNAIFRAAHSIKGGGATFGFLEVSNFAHHVETLLDQMRTGERAVVRDDVDLLLSSVDCMREMIADVADGSPDTTAADALQKKLEDTIAAGEASGGTEDNLGIAHDANHSAVIAGWQIEFKPYANLFRSGNDPLRIVRELSRLGRIDVVAEGLEHIDFDTTDPEDCLLHWAITLHSAPDEAQLNDLFTWVENEADVLLSKIHHPQAETTMGVDLQTPSAKQVDLIEPPDVLAGTQPKPRTDAASAVSMSTARSPTSAESSSIRVNIDKVDALINLVGELVITQSMLSRFNADFDFTQLDTLREGLAQLHRNTRELQESVLAIRMLPISFAFSRFPRLVRDTCNALGKKVELQLKGEQTELDKTVLEKMGDPLVHLVRNSLDHGLESPEVRAAAGKPEVGTLTLNAYHEGGNIVIEVTDDGAGVNKDKVLSKAIEQGLVSADESLSDDQIANLIFMPGFSTAEQVSDLSGRGVGMDVVRRNIADLGGQVSVRTETGVGSTFTIRLPLTLAILDGQLVRLGQESYIISLVSIVETIQCSAQMVSRIAGASEMFKLRDQYLPILRLNELFGVDARSNRVEDGLLVVVEANSQRVGILVDDLKEQQQVVIKSLEDNYRQMPGISGATILGDGKVALILDVPGLIQMFFKRKNFDDSHAVA